MKIPITLFLFLIISNGCVCQTNNLDSLRIALHHSTGTDHIKTLLELCWGYRFINADTARAFGNRALALAKHDGALDLETEALHYISITHEAQGNYNEALTYE